MSSVPLWSLREQEYMVDQLVPRQGPDVLVIESAASGRHPLVLIDLSRVSVFYAKTAGRTLECKRFPLEDERIPGHRGHIRPDVARVRGHPQLFRIPIRFNDINSHHLLSEDNTYAFAQTRSPASRGILQLFLPLIGGG